MNYKQAHAVVNGKSITIYVSYPLPGQPDFFEKLTKELVREDYKEIAVRMLTDAGFNVSEINFTHI